MQDALRNFFRLEAAGAILLLIAAALAMVLQNSPLADLYQAFLDTPVAIQVGGLEIAKPLFLWVNDGLMAIFFFMIGMEVKREVMVGELSRFDQVLLPLIAGVGGIAVPAAIYYLLTADDPTALQGWAIPTATDIAFALGILALLGPRVPATLKIFLLTIAIIDDLGAITIIALFYTNDLSLTSLSVAAGAIAVLGILKWRGVTKITVYMLVGVVLWVSVLKSGVHATLAGVVLGFFIPLESVDDDGTRHKPLDSLIHDLHYAVAFGILPLFAFVNAGVNLTGMTPDTLFSGVPLAIVAGLFIGKQLGVFTFAWIAIKSGICEMPKHLRWSHIYGVAALCGVGFTMSLFIGSLAFEGTGLGYARPDRLGIIVGSLLSGAVGYIVLRMTEPLHDLEKDS
ncbi:MAG: Na+/H+ antiporter NhaA [Gammaproteobacteria bacterium]|nr:Na+/H+ antiporter NhaA [Gammaproteobacteria bacterium]